MLSTFASATFLAALAVGVHSTYGQSSDDVPSDASPGADDTPEWFREVGASAGVQWSHISDRSDQFRFPEIMGGGLALFDCDGDGDLDIYLVQGGLLEKPPAKPEGENESESEAEKAPPLPGNKLFRNDSSEGTLRFVDITEEAGVGDTGYGMGAACGDFDRDGDIDLFVTNVGANVLYSNNGDGTFKDISKKNKIDLDTRWTTSATFFDANGDGKLDIYAVNNLGWSKEVETPCVNYYQERDYCSPTNYNAPQADAMYTFGRLGFSDATARTKIDTSLGNGLGVVTCDYDLDGDNDVYVANDATANVLWNNNGRGQFENGAKLGGCAVNGQGRPEAGMGVQFVDLNDDGYMDLFITHLRRETNTFYRNRNGRFTDKSNTVGTNGASLKLTGFGMGIHDFDLDGTLDLFVANGAVQAWKEAERFVQSDAYAEPNHIFKGEMGKRGVKFSLLRDAGATSSEVPATSRGAAFGDLDGDGDVDVVVVDLDAPVKVLENIAPRTEGAGQWVGFRLVEGRKNAAVQGAIVSAEIGGKRVYRLADPTYSYLASNDHRVHFGLGANDVAKDVRVRWPGGQEQSFGDLPAGKYHELTRRKK